MTEKNRDIVAVVLIGLAVCAAYVSCLPNNFIFDDYHMIVRNNYVKDPVYAGSFFKGAVTTYPVAGGMYRPLLMLTFSLNYLAGRLAPHGYHLVNIFIHFLNACFLYLLLRYFFKNPGFPVCAGLALIFAVHPLNTEAVAYVSSRSIILCGAFILAAVYSYILWRNTGKKKYYFFSAGLYALALFTKETALVFPLLLAAYEFVFTPEISKKAAGRTVKNTAVFLCITAAYLVLIKSISGSVFGLFGSPPAGAAARSVLSNVLTQSAVSFFYLFLFMFPFNLCVDHAFPVISGFSHPAGSAGILLVGVSIGSALFLRRRFPAVSFGILWYYACLVPQFYVRLNLPSAEHHAYLAFFGIYFIIAHLSAAALKKAAERGEPAVTALRRAARPVFVFVFSLFSVLTVIRCLEWRNEYTLWKATLRVNPRSGIAQGSLALNLIGRGFFKEGLRYLEESAGSSVHSAIRVTSLMNLIYYQALLGDPSQAARLLDENKDLFMREYPFGYFKNLAVVCGKLGRPDEQFKALEAALRLVPESEEINSMLGWWYLDTGSGTERAEYFFRAAIRYNPDYSFSHLGLARTFEKKGLFNEAIAEYEEVIRVAPDYHEAYYNIGLIYAQRFSGGRAEGYFRKCIELSPEFAPAYYQLCVYYLSLPEPDRALARQYCDKAGELGYAVEERIENLLQAQEHRNTEAQEHR